MPRLNERPKLKRLLAQRLTHKNVDNDKEQHESRKRYEKNSAKMTSSAESNREATEGRGGERRSDRRKMESSNRVRLEGWAAAERDSRRQIAWDKSEGRDVSAGWDGGGFKTGIGSSSSVLSGK